jgi:hypothetical protein
MAKATKPNKEIKKRGEYEQPLKVNGSFMDIMKAAVKDAKSKDKKKP